MEKHDTNDEEQNVDKHDAGDEEQNVEKDNDDEDAGDEEQNVEKADTGDSEASSAIPVLVAVPLHVWYVCTYMQWCYHLGQVWPFEVLLSGPSLFFTKHCLSKNTIKIGVSALFF